jgi:hypothetical protein
MEYKKKAMYLNDIKAGIDKIKKWIKDSQVKLKLYLHIGGSADHLSNVLVCVNKKTVFDYLKELLQKYHEINAYDWVDWVDSRLELTMTNNGLIFINHHFDVERVELEE